MRQRQWSHVCARMQAGEDTTDAQQEVRTLKDELDRTTARVAQLDQEVDRLIKSIGNIVHQSVPVSDDEALNATVKTWGTTAPKPQGKHHHEIMYMIDGYSPEQGSVAARAACRLRAHWKVDSCRPCRGRASWILPQGRWRAAQPGAD